MKIVKIGGNVIDDPEKLSVVLAEFAELKGQKILVHGGGKKASSMLEQMKIPVKIADGRRITDSASLEVVQMVYAGLINKNIVADLQAKKCMAIGLSGADAGIILAHKRPVVNIDYGFVGDIENIHTDSLIKILKNGFIPVFCALTHDGRGQILNTNADTIASALGSALAETYNVDIVYCFEMNGVLTDIKNPDSVISHINKQYYKDLRNGNIISDGMIPKIDNAFSALEKGVKNVFIRNFKNLAQEQSGTRISQS
ncbi:MAG: acetylglutamate kinase [Calditrichaceae bacterium]